MRKLALAALVAVALSGCGVAPAETGVALATMSPHQAPDYDRDAFGQAWSDDVDVHLGHNGCDTRNDILARDLEGEVFKPGTRDCVVLTGTLYDWYTDSVIEFRRGQGTSDDVQIDHVVPLSWAWEAGAWSWDPEQRKLFANDPANLLAVDGPTNSAKGDSGPSEWMPPNRDYHCEYFTHWDAMVTLYELTPPPADAHAIALGMQECMG